MNRPGRNAEFLSFSGVTDLTIDLELQLTFKDKNEFISVMDEILPTLTRWINPQFAAETPRCPVNRHILLVYGSHYFQ
jgi:hypothetical protein